MGYEAVKKLYAEKGIGGALQPQGRSALLVIDLINGFIHQDFPAGSDLDGVVNATHNLLSLARASGQLVIFTSIAFHEKAGQSIWLKKMPAMSGLVFGSPWTAVDERLEADTADIVLYKSAASAFFGTDLQSILKNNHIESLVICGATTSGCVRATVVDACMYGYTAFVPRECVGDRAVEPHEAALFDIQAKYGEVISLQDAGEILAHVHI
ncbi:isochorismatase family protein [Advenella sp. WQ 585]|uniref:Isochorismatase family protein n=1 Tax=Advenella mandrilli TaxID=2800330 RepID=A0ABS1E9H1_9BURK|nr:isochorismatase family protein [Advenella mandrilli]MBK1780394.1 isochorismatase family protein [Advenella mandrilli]